MEIFIVFSLLLLLVIFQIPIGNGIEKLITKYQYRQFLSQQTFYHAIVSQHLRFYNRLDHASQERFLFRTWKFRQEKKFHYIEVEERAEMSILVSAVAIQLTFGLEKFQLGYFRNIFILKDDYHYGFYSRPFQGHVDHSGIYLSWDNFEKGIQGLSPNCNVGLHEMAHGLAYVNFITQTEEDRHFKKEFKQYSKVARPIFTAMQNGEKNILGDYAGTNYHEFWAVSVEIFFENPLGLFQELPALYEVMVKLLRQDPLASAGKISLAA